MLCNVFYDALLCFMKSEGYGITYHNSGHKPPAIFVASCQVNMDASHELAAPINLGVIDGWVVVFHSITR